MPRRKTLRIATFNVNGIGTRLPQLLDWLHRESPDVVALQELKATDAAFPAAALEEAGYGALWQGEARWNGVALLARGTMPVESRRRLPGEPKDTQSRYLEAAVHGVIVGALYLPNGNPQPGPKFDYKLRWMERLIRHARSLVEVPHPALLLGDFNVIPNEADVYDPKAWRRDALFSPRFAMPSSGCSRRAGPMRCERCTATPRSTPSGTISANMPSATVGCASIICC